MPHTTHTHPRLKTVVLAAAIALFATVFVVGTLAQGHAPEDDPGQLLAGLHPQDPSPKKALPSNEPGLRSFGQFALAQDRAPLPDIEPGDLSFHDQLSEDVRRDLTEDTDSAAVLTDSIALARQELDRLAPDTAAQAARVTTKPAGIKSEGRYALQVSAYRRRARADAFAVELQGHGHESYITESRDPERGTFYRVRIGPFKSRFQAERHRKQIERDFHIAPFVVENR